MVIGLHSRASGISTLGHLPLSLCGNGPRYSPAERPAPAGRFEDRATLDIASGVPESDALLIGARCVTRRQIRLNPMVAEDDGRVEIPDQAVNSPHLRRQWRSLPSPGARSARRPLPGQGEVKKNRAACVEREASFVCCAGRARARRVRVFAGAFCDRSPGSPRPRSCSPLPRSRCRGCIGVRVPPAWGVAPRFPRA